MKEPKSYMTRWGHNDYRVSHWDSFIEAYRESAPMSYWMARIVVGEANCRHKTDGKCDKVTHDHSP